MSSNMQRLGNMLSDRMKKTAGAYKTTALELGTINSNLSLTIDSLSGTVPKGDYMVNIMLTGSEPVDTGQENPLPSVIKKLEGGDRVLVAWCGNEPVVIAVVISS